MPIGGFVITVDPKEIDTVKAALEGRDACEVHGTDDKGNIVAVIDTETSDVMDDIVKELEQDPRILSVGLAYLHAEDEVDKIIRGEIVPMSRNDGNTSRREVLRGLTAVTLAGLVGAPSLASAGPLGRDRLRPPGAIDESEFASRCIRCGRCAAVCPYESIKLLGLTHGLDSGTPIVEIVDVPCYMCMECVDVCPTRAMVPIELEQTAMGTAWVDHETCVAWNGTAMCRTCYSVCPLRDRAITNWEFKPEIVADVCTGCGICVHACPIVVDEDHKAIAVFPPGQMPEARS